MYDLVIRRGHVADGSGRPAFRSDVALRNGVIAAVETDIDGEARETVDAAGKLVCPGFIDVHTHDDLAVLRDPYHEPKLLQGVTSVVLGNCGHGCAPTGGAPELLESYSSPVLGSFPHPLRWQSFPEYLRTLAASPTAVNTTSLVPHGALRAAAMGYTSRTAGEREIREMAAMLTDALRSGAAGMSLGLMYAPGCYADRRELTELARVVARHDALLACHLRSEGSAIGPSLEELVEVGRAAEATIHISHLKVVSPVNFGSMPGILERLDGLRAAGVELTADVYPYDAGSTTISGLFPPSSLDGGVDGLLHRLTERSGRQHVRELLEQPWPDAENHLLALGGGRIRMCGFQKEHNLVYEGMYLADIAAERGQDDIECLLDLFVEERAGLTVIQFQMAEDDVTAALRWPWSMIGSDGLPLPARLLHPRHYGTFPRVFARYVRERGVLPIETAVRKMTSLPAHRFGLHGKGEIRPGHHADLCVVSPGSVEDLATYDDPRHYPNGIDLVVVNGRVAAEGTRPRVTAGRYLTAPGT